MALGTFDFFSAALHRCVTFRILLPNDLPPEMCAGNAHYDRPMKTLYLLHGFSGCSTDWLLNSRISELAGKYNLAVVLPAGENSFYLDGAATGCLYGTYTGAELVDYTRRVFGLSPKKEDTFIGGLSMGGFGAVHTGLAYPETFGRLFSLSGALIIHNVETMRPGFADGIANYDYYRQMFGEPEKAAQSRANPEVLVDELLAAKKALPGIYLAIGTEDFLYQENQIFRRFLTQRGVPFTYAESAGVHDFVFWNRYLEPAIQWLLQ